MRDKNVTMNKKTRRKDQNGSNREWEQTKSNLEYKWEQSTENKKAASWLY